MLKRSSRGPTEMRGSWAHKGITARSRAKPVALEKGVRGGSDGGTCRNGWNEKKGFGAATIPCKDRVRQRREDLGERLPKWEAQRSESKKVSKEKGSSFAYRRALFCRCLLGRTTCSRALWREYGPPSYHNGVMTLNSSPTELHCCVCGFYMVNIYLGYSLWAAAVNACRCTH